MPGVQVDGFNVFAIYEAVREAVERARSGQGPTLIEARYMRMQGHHVGDDQSYRSPEDLARIEVLYQAEPLIRTRAFLKSSGVEDVELDAIQARARMVIEEAVEYAGTQCHEPSIDTLYQDIYADGEIIQ